MTYAAEKAEYREMSDEFVDINRQWRRAVSDDTLTDELDLRFFRAEKALKAKYRDMQRAKIAELAEESDS